MRQSQPLIPEDVIFGCSALMSELRGRIARMGPTDLPVLIAGESGSGKEVMARFVHRSSPRCGGPFVKVNCPAIPRELMESELFGYEQGAFTGAYREKPGLVEQAAAGTLFLDEIAELDLQLQAKLLQLLQDGTFSRIGGREPLQADFRVICATSRVLELEIAAGRFRQDLLYRINVLSVEMPPLRLRTVDIPFLVEYFLDLYRQEYGRSVEPVSPRLMHLLMAHTWPGNIRELENVLRRYVVLGAEQAIAADLLDSDPKRSIGPAGGALSLKQLTRRAVHDLERQIILDVLHANHWNRKETARMLKISYRSLFYKLKNAGVPNKRARAGARAAVPAPMDTHD